MPPSHASERFDALLEMERLPEPVELASGQALNTPAAKALRDWVWAMEMSEPERALFRGMSPCSLQAALLNSLFHPDGCEPGVAGARARRRARALWLGDLAERHGLMDHRSFDELTGRSPGSPSPLPAPARRAGQALRLSEAVGAPAGGTGLLALLACSMAPAAPEALILGSGFLSFGSLCAFAAGRLIRQSSWSPERRALRRILLEAYPEEAAGALAPREERQPRPERAAAPSQAGIALKRAILTPEMGPGDTWAELSVRAAREACLLQDASAPPQGPSPRQPSRRL